MSWTLNQPDRWKNEQSLAKELFINPSFEVAKDGCALIFGLISIEKEALGTIGPFFLKVLYSPDFPKHDPNVYLLNHEDWRVEANHIEKDGRFCWSEAKDAPIDFERADSLRLLIENIAFRLMQAETMMRKGLQALPGPERAHFEAGEREARSERKRNGIGPNTKPCICGKNVKYKRCHGKREVFRRRAD